MIFALLYIILIPLDIHYLGAYIIFDIILYTLHVYIVPGTIDIGETITGHSHQGERMFFQLALPSDGLTIQLSVQEGHVVSYVSDRLTNPTQSQGYDWRVETDNYTDLFIDPTLLERDSGEYVYIAIEGLQANNNFSLNSTVGDHRGLFNS